LYHYLQEDTIYILFAISCEVPMLIVYSVKILPMFAE